MCIRDSYRHFVFAETHGAVLPEIDWSASGDDIGAVVQEATDPAVLEYLERELWAARQAFASSGRADQAATLGGVAAAEFRASPFRTDPFFTTLPGSPSVHQTVLSASTMGTISVLTLLWLGLIIASLAATAVLLARSRAATLRWWLLWLAAAAVTGPVAPLVHEGLRRRGGARSLGWEALAAAVIAMGGYGVAWTAAMHLIVSAGEDPGPIILIAGYGVPFLTGLLLVRGPMWATKAGSYRRSVRSSLVAEFTTVHIAVAVPFTTTLIADSRILTIVPHPTSPYFWSLLGPAAILGCLLLWMIQYGLTHRGFDVWPATATESAVRLPMLREAWWIPLTTLAVMVVLIGAGVALFG